MTKHEPAPLDKLLALAQGYAESAMRNIDQFSPALLADSPTGATEFVPHSLKDARANDNFANTARLIYLGYEVTAAVLVLEAWMKQVKPGETLDVTEPRSEALDRREVVALTGETAQHGEQRLPRLIRTDAGGFFGFDEHGGPKFHNHEGRFAQLLPLKRPTAAKSDGGYKPLAAKLLDLQSSGFNMLTVGELNNRSVSKDVFLRKLGIQQIRNDH